LEGTDAAWPQRRTWLVRLPAGLAALECRRRSTEADFASVQRVRWTEASERAERLGYYETRARVCVRV